MTMVTRRYFYESADVDGDKELDYLTSSLNPMSLPTSTYHTVNAATQYRPDLISMLFYNTYDLGWLIADHNNMTDPIEDLTIGRVIKIPAVDDYYRYYNRNTRSS